MGIWDCGFPLSIKCTNASPLPSPSIFQEDNDSMFASGFGWKAVFMSYGCGFGFGLTVGYVFWFKTKKTSMACKVHWRKWKDGLAK